MIFNASSGSRSTIRKIFMILNIKMYLWEIINDILPKIFIVNFQKYRSPFINTLILSVMSITVNSYSQCSMPSWGNNLILNGGFENSCVTPITTGEFYAEAFDPIYGCVENWSQGQGSPHIIVSPFTGVFPDANGGFFYTCLAAATHESGACYWTESIYQHLNGTHFFAGQPYNLRFLSRSAETSFSSPHIGPGSAPIDVQISAANNIQYAYPPCTGPIFDDNEVIYNSNEYNQNSWQPVEICNFTLLSNYDDLLFKASNDDNLEQSLFLIDNIELWCESLIDPIITYTNIGNVYSFSLVDPNVSIDGLTIINWNWDFGDGATSTAESPQHTFQEQYFDQVCVCFTDSRGCRRKICVQNPSPCACEGTQHLSQSITVSSNVAYNKNLIIDPGAVLTFDGGIKTFKRNCKILVKRGARLNIVNGAILKDESCDNSSDTWGGVQVWGTWTQEHPNYSDISTTFGAGNINFLDANHGIVYANHGLIKNIKNKEWAGAIEAGPNAPFIDELNADGGDWEGHFGGIVISDDVTIDNSTIGITLQKYPAPGYNNYTVNTIRNSKFNQCRFGISNASNNGLTVSNTLFELGSGFAQNSWGISAYNANTVITESTFENYRTGIIAEGSAYPQMNLIIGDKSSNLTGNTFNNCILGARLHNVNRSEIYYNDFNFNTSWSLIDAGIWLDGTNGYDVYSNHFDGHMIGVGCNNTGDNNAYANLSCNTYHNYLVAINALGNNQVTHFNNETFEVGDIGLNYNANPGKLPNQGSSTTACYNNFSGPDTDIKTQSSYSLTTPKFYYFYNNHFSSDFRPTCALNNSDCIATGNFDEKKATGFQNDCPTEITIENPLICITNECIEDYNDEINSNRISIANGDNDAIYNAIVGNYATTGTISYLNSASPYLSDRMLIAIINSSYFNETQKRNYCINNAPLNFSVTDVASIHLTITSMAVINAVEGPSPRNILENEIEFLERDKWRSINGFIAANFTTAGYDDIEELLNNQTESIAKKVLLQVQLGMGKFTEARDLIHYIPNVTEDYKKLQWLYLNILSLRNYVPTNEENALLSNMEDGLTQDASLARSIRTLLTGQDYYPQLPISGEDTRIKKPYNFAKENIRYANIQPNPANNEVLITQINTKEQNSELMYQINNINGSEFASGKFLDKIPIDISSWPQGIYFIKIYSKNGVQLIKLIKL